MKKIICLIIISILISGCVGPTRDQDRRQPPQDGIQPTQDQDRRQPPQDGIQPTQDQDRRQPPRDQIGIKFISLAQGESKTANIDNAKIMIADSLEKADFIEWLDQDAANAIKEVDFNQNIVIAVFRGKFSTSGFTIFVSDIKISEGKVKINAKLSDPTGQVADVILYPYDIIVVSRGDLKKGMTFELVSNNSLLASR